MRCFPLITDTFKTVACGGSHCWKSKLSNNLGRWKPATDSTMCREEFRLRNFKLWHPILRDFTHSRVSEEIELQLNNKKIV